MQRIRLPNGEVLQFPDGMSDDDMAAAITENYPQFAGDGTAPAAAAPATAPGIEQSTIGKAIGSVTRPLLDAINGAGDAIRNIPVVRPTPHPDGVMGAAMEEAERTGKPMPRSPAPEGVGDFTWARAQAAERREPLDPRLVAIKPADPLALAEQQAALRANAGNKLFAGIMAKAREDNARDAAEAKRQADMYSLENLAGNTVKNVRNVTAGVLKIGPTALKGGADIARLFTGDTVGKDTSEAMQRGMKAIDEVVASAQFNEQSAEFQQLMASEQAGVGDLFEFLIDNPAIMLDAGITTVGSMALPAGAAKLGVMGARAAGLGAKGVGTAATVASAGTVAAQNAGDTFTSPEVANLDMADRYKAAAVSGAISVLSGMAFKGGAEGEIARRMAGDLRAGRTTLEAVKGYIKAALNEGAQEAGEEAGNIMGTSVATLEAPGFNNAVKQLAFAGTLGAIFGAGTHSVTGHAGPDDGSAAAEQARRDALNRWNTDGLTGRPAPAGRAEPTMGAPAGAVDTPERNEPTLEDVASATTLDAAIAAAQAVASKPAASPHATAAEIDALEEAAFLAGAGEVAPAAVPQPAPAAAAVDAAPAPAPAGNVDGALPAADLPPGGETAPQADPAGKNDDPDDWYDFPPESRTLRMPRAQMPQIKAEHRGAMVNFLGARGISHEQVTVEADDLKPTQREFSVSKVQKAIDYVGGNRSILISSDNYVLDGHHQWLASAEKGEPVQAIRLNAPIKQLINTVRQFPSAGVDTSSEAAPAKVRPGQELADANDRRIQRQEDAVRQAIENEAKRKNTGGQRARDRVAKENPLLAFLASHGLNMDERSDTGGQGGRAGQIMVPGYGQLYRRSGKRLDELAQLAREAGFLTQDDIDNPSDTGGTRKLADMIQRAVHGREAIAPAGLLDAVAPTNDQRLIAEAQRLGIETEGKTADEVYDAVTAAHEAEEARREVNGATSVDEQAEIERWADTFTDREAQLAADLARDADIPLDGGTPSDNLTDEDIDAIFGIQPGSARAAGQQAEEGAEGAAREGAARAGPASEGEAEPLLSSYTPEEVAARDAEAAARAKADKAEADRLERQRAADQLAREKQQRIAGTVDDFQLGQSAEEALAGQRSIFDAPAPSATEPAKSETKPAESATKAPETASTEAESAFSELLANKAMAPYRELGDAGRASYKAGFIAGYEGQTFPAAAVKDGAMDDGYQLGKRQAREKDAVIVQGEDGRPVIDYARLRFPNSGYVDIDLSQKLIDRVQEALRTRPDSYTVSQRYTENDTRLTLPNQNPNRAGSNNGGQFLARDDGLVYLVGDNSYGWGSTMSTRSAVKTLTEWLDNMPPAPESNPGTEATGGSIVEAKMGPTAQRMLRADRNAFAQPRIHTYNPDNARPALLIACSEKKLEGTHRAVDLYQGAMFDVLRKWMPKDNPPDVFIISAKHGLVHANELLENYEQPMNQERLEALLEKGIPAARFINRDFNEVFIAGSAPYRELGQVYTERMRSAGFLAPSAKVLTSADGAGIGTQRGDLGAYLKRLEAEATPETAARAQRLEEEAARRKRLEAEREAINVTERAAAAAKKAATVKTPGTNLEWSTLGEWMDAQQQLEGRAASSKRTMQLLEHLGALARNPGIITSETDADVLEQAKQLLEGKQAGRGKRQNDPATTAVQLIGTQLAKVKSGRAQLDNATAPEHIAGVDDRELGQIVEEFNDAQAEMMQDGQAITNIFTAPAKADVVRLEDKTKVYTKEHGWMTVAEAKARIKEWKDHAYAQGEGASGRENSRRVVLSLFDLTGKWSQPWEDAGYQVYRFDIQDDPEVGDVNNFSTEFFGDWFGDFEGMDVYAVLAACPCTDFASSGSRHFAAKDADGRTVASVKLVHQTLRVIEYFKPAVWAVENPVGRIEKLGGLPPWRLSFNPNHLGDPYTKRTLIWGRFNGDLPIAPVEPTEGSKMHKLYGGKSMATKNARSATPEGFSYGFFMANNAIDNPVLAIHGKFDRLDRKLIEQAVAAGVTEEQITSAVDDHYYIELDDDAANDAIRELIAEARDSSDPATPTTPAAEEGGQIPLDFYRTVDVDYLAVAGTEPQQLKADVALANTRTDIERIEAMLKCMGE